MIHYLWICSMFIRLLDQMEQRARPLLKLQPHNGGPVPEKSTGIMNGFHEILELMFDSLARWNGGSFMESPCWLCRACFCWLVYMQPYCGMGEVETRWRSVRPQHWQQFPPWPSTVWPFLQIWHSLQANWSSLEGLTQCQFSSTCTIFGNGLFCS